MAEEIGFIEDFALSDNREETLQQLIPGTEQYYYFYCVHYQNSEQFDKVEDLLKQWVARHGETAMVRLIRNRQALLTYPKNPQLSLEYLRQQLGIQFNHQREVLGQKPTVPTELDQKLISRQQLMKQALAEHKNTDGFEERALQWLINEEISAEQRRHLLQRLGRPDYDNLVELVIKDLDFQNSGGFGSFNIHQQLLHSQLNELLERKPALLNQTEFVNIYVSKLQPNPDVDWQNDDNAHREYLERVWEFVKQLGPAHNALKVNNLYHRLQFDLEHGEYNRERFLEYVKLPRNVFYVNPKYLELDENRRYQANLGEDFRSICLLPPIGNDEPLVRSYLLQFFEKDADYQAYSPYINDNYLKQVFAEAKIVNGLGDPEKWISLLTPQEYQALKDRVDLEFLPTNKRDFHPEDPVAIDLYVKNVETLIVKVFEINTQNYFRQQLRQLDTDINLDGLVPNQETVHTYDDAPVRRIKRRFEFPELNGAGVYVVDFIGNGKSSRALIRKGQLRYLVNTAPLGQEFTVLDQDDRQVKDARIWLGGREFTADAEGKILIPFSNDPGRQPIVITQGDVSSLDYFNHLPESYDFTAALYVDRESLLRSNQTKLVVRPSLKLSGTPVTLSLLEEVSLLIRSTDLDGTQSTQTVPDFKLFEDRESVFEFRVPQRLATIEFALTAKVKKLTKIGEKQDVAVQQSFEINQIDRTFGVDDFHFVQAAGKYYVEIRGRTGERNADRALNLSIKHLDFTRPVTVSLRSDEMGRISLGELTDIARVQISGLLGVNKIWSLPQPRHTYYQTINGIAGQPIEIPYMGGREVASRDEFSLLEVLGGKYVADRFDSISIENGQLKIAALERGDYLLSLKNSGQVISLNIAKGEKLDDYILGENRRLEVRQGQPLQITSLAADGDKIRIQLNRHDAFTRVHVFATRFEPRFDAYANLAAVRDVEPYQFSVAKSDSLYVAGRKIGDEYQYILDRKYAKKFPGNMLDRPKMLLNPWAIRSTSTSVQEPMSGGEFAGSDKSKETDGGRTGGQEGEQQSLADFANLDFLPEGSALLLNLTADEQGVLEFDRLLVDDRQQITVVALDALMTTTKTLTLELKDEPSRDLRLLTGLDPDKHFTQQKTISILRAGETLTLDDIRSSRIESYDNLRDVYRLLLTLNPDQHLTEFRFVLDWPEKELKEKRELYAKYACHELNFFLLKKDPEFFETVVRPHLANKLDKTFLDQWLLKSDLQAYLDPWRHAQLNVVERTLLGISTDAGMENTRRHIQDLYDLHPTPRAEAYQLFGTAVTSSSLDAGDRWGITDRERDLSVRLQDEKQAQLGQAKSESGAADLTNGAIIAGGFGTQAPGKPNAEPAMKKSQSESPKSDERLARHSESLNKLSASMRGTGKGDADGDGYFRKKSGAQDELAERLYEKLDRTMEWAENNYYKLLIGQQNADLVNVNQFWKDYAAHDPNQPFFSRYFPESAGNFTEMMFALSVLDLPFKAAEQLTEIEENQMKLTAVSPLIAFHEEIRPAIDDRGNTSILVSQNIFRQDDRYTYDGADRLDKFVRDEFLTDVGYGCQVVVTNPTSSPQKVDILLQTPVGAFPINGSKYTRSVNVDLEPYRTQSVEYYFYFPTAGEYQHYPVHVAKNDRVLAFAEPNSFPVVTEPSKIDRESWAYLSQNGTDEEVLDFLAKHNPLRLELAKIAFRMQDKEYFQRVIALLKQRHAYENTLWSYSIKHDDVNAIAEYLAHRDDFLGQCGLYLDSPLVKIDPVVRKWYEHLEYDPLVNARAHQLGRRRQILNDRFFEQYNRLLTVLSLQRKPDSQARLAVTYYLLLQDRIDESLKFFAQVSPDELPTRLQYDYFTAYLDMFSAEPSKARQIADKYVSYPVDRWQKAFTAVSAQVAEIDGNKPQIVDEDDRNQQQTQLASKSPSFDFKVDAKKVNLSFQNLKQVTVNYYVMDVELLFSRNPFVQEQSGELAYVKPKTSETIELPADATTHVWDLPEALHKSNVLVEITGAGQTKSQAYYAHALNVQMIENYGQVQISHADSGKRIPKAYVKVYARTRDGDIRFYKDGYTDLRGRFEYTSLSTNELDNVERFAVLILSEEQGAVVREAIPPKQ